MSEPFFSGFYHIHPLGWSGTLRHFPLLELDKTRDHVTQLTVLLLSGEINIFHKRKEHTHKKNKHMVELIHDHQK